MSQQALDLRRSIKIVRRHRWIFWSVVVIGLLVGAFYAVLRPPMLTSTALVVLPEAPVLSDQAAASGAGQGTTAYVDTQAVVASSTPVLSAALPHVSPIMSLQTLRNRTHAGTLTDAILSISASGATAVEAETTANAVASSYVSFVTSKHSPVSDVHAKILQAASTATGFKLPEQVVLDGLLGALGGAIAGFIAALAIGRNDRRLIERGAIASSIGAPVLASIPVGHPSGATSWAKLLEEYVPGPVHAWALRNMLQQFGLADYAVSNGARAGAHTSGHESTAVTVLSLSSDPKALALGPQLAVFAASLGIPTALVIGPQHDAGTVASLRTACAASETAGSGTPLRLMVSEDGEPEQSATAFAVVVTVVDDQAPRMPDAPSTTATVLGVSAGGATAEQLARVATAAAGDGREIFGILVADPEPTDQTTGRIPRLAPPALRQMPTRVKDVPTEIKR
jgi:capsular polysaccharide biosynthesis protein